MLFQQAKTSSSVLSTATKRQVAPRGRELFAQGDLADGVFYIWRGFVKQTIVSEQGKEAVIGVLGPSSFFGYACLSGRKLRESTATAVCDCIVSRIDLDEMSRLLRDDGAFSGAFLSYVSRRNLQLEADLADQLCNSCEMRLARTLLALSAMNEATGSSPLLPMIDQQTLAGIVGTTQPRISVLLSRFRRRGLIDYEGGLKVKSELGNVVCFEAVRESTRPTCKTPIYSILNNA